MHVDERLKRSIALRKDDVFLRSDFARLGSPAQLSRALRQQACWLSLPWCVRQGEAQCADRQAYPCSASGGVAPPALQNLGVKVGAPRAVHAYNSGTFQQLAVGVVLNTERRRISRKLGFGKQTVAL